MCGGGRWIYVLAKLDKISNGSARLTAPDPGDNPIEGVDVDGGAEYSNSSSSLSESVSFGFGFGCGCCRRERDRPSMRFIVAIGSSDCSLLSCLTPSLSTTT